MSFLIITLSGKCKPQATDYLVGDQLFRDTAFNHLPLNTSFLGKLNVDTWGFPAFKVQVFGIVQEYIRKLTYLQRKTPL